MPVKKSKKRPVKRAKKAAPKRNFTRKRPKPVLHSFKVYATDRRVNRNVLVGEVQARDKQSAINKARTLLKGQAKFYSGYNLGARALNKGKKKKTSKKKNLFGFGRKAASAKAKKLRAKASKLEKHAKRPTVRARVKAKVAKKAHGLVSRILGNPKRGGKKRNATHTAELDSLIKRAKDRGARIRIKYDQKAMRDEGRRIYETIQVEGLKGIGPYPMSPISAAEALRSALAKKPNSPKRRNKTVIRAKRVLVLNKGRGNPKGAFTRSKRVHQLMGRDSKLLKQLTAAMKRGDVKAVERINKALKRSTQTWHRDKARYENPKRRNSPSSEASQQRKEFSGKSKTSDLRLFMPPAAPKEGLSTLGPLKLLVMSDGRKYKAAPGVWAVRDLRGKVHFGTSKQGGVIWNGPKEDLGAVARIEYGPMAKPHLGEKRAVFFHKFGSPLPHLQADGQGGACLKGGSYSIRAEGIEH